MRPKPDTRPDIIDTPGHLTSLDAAILLDNPGEISPDAYQHQLQCAECTAAMMELGRISFKMALEISQNPASETVSPETRDAMLKKIPIGDATTEEKV